MYMQFLAIANTLSEHAGDERMTERLHAYPLDVFCKEETLHLGTNQNKRLALTSSATVKRACCSLPLYTPLLFRG